MSIIINAKVLGIALLVALFAGSASPQVLLVAMRPVIEVGLIGYFIFRLLSLMRYVYEIYFNPAIVFVGGFFAIIVAGAFLLIIPNATADSISVLDALFTATAQFALPDILR